MVRANKRSAQRRRGYHPGACDHVRCALERLAENRQVYARIRAMAIGFSGSDALVYLNYLYHFKLQAEGDQTAARGAHAACRELVNMWARLKNSRRRRRNL